MRIQASKRDLIDIKRDCYKHQNYDIKTALASVERLINEADQTFQHEPTKWAELCRIFAVFFIHVRAALHLIKEDVRDAYLEDMKPAAQKTFDASQIRQTFFGEQGIKQEITRSLKELDRSAVRNA